MTLCEKCIHGDICADRDCLDADDEKALGSCNDFKNKADFVEVKHARWIEESSLYVHCSACKTREYPREHNFKSKVCPCCGAKMDGKPQKEV